MSALLLLSCAKTMHEEMFTQVPPNVHLVILNGKVSLIKFWIGSLPRSVRVCCSNQNSICNYKPNLAWPLEAAFIPLQNRDRMLHPQLTEGQRAL